MYMRFLKVGAVIFGALVITTLGINAADVFNGNAGSMLGQMIATEQGGCPEGMTGISVAQTFSCVDTYEASPSEICPNTNPRAGSDTQDNLNEIECVAASAASQSPWVHVSREQAQVACMRAGKRLPTAAEWYTFALGTPDTSACNTQSSGVSVAGSQPECKSASGVYDAIGNAWEWTSDDVIEGQYQGRALPAEGYVTQVASDGVATVSDTSPSEQFEEDYIWTSETGAYGVLRGGYYGSKEDAGVYTIQAKTPPTAATVAIGFRCVK